MLKVEQLRERRRSIFYGWWIVSAGIGVQVLLTGLMMQAFGVYVSVLQADFGWSKTALSAAFSMQRVESGILGPAQGWMLTRYGPRNVMRVGIVMFGIGFLLFSQINSLLTFYLVFLLMAVGASLGGFMAVITSLVNWFDRKRSTAMGVAYTGLSLGGLVVPLVAWSLDTVGWRTTAVISGILVLSLGLPLTSLVRTRPEDYGEYPDGIDPATRRARRAATSGVEEDEEEEPEFTAREALRTRAFWFISLGHGMAVLMVSAIMVHLVVNLNEELGYSLQTAALVVALMTLLQTAGQLGGGFLGDRYNKRVILTLTMLGHGTAIIVLAFATNYLMVLFFAVVHGIAWGVRGPVLHSYRADCFGRASFAQVLGFSSMIVMFGMTAGPLVAGILADRTGDYQLAFFILGVFACLGSLFFAFATKPTPPEEQPIEIGSELAASSGLRIST
ncbi:MAG: MFS transporter [Thermomicrobiales bacterium]